MFVLVLVVVIVPVLIPVFLQSDSLVLVTGWHDLSAVLYIP
jgi:hypothetical protein